MVRVSPPTRARIGARAIVVLGIGTILVFVAAALGDLPPPLQVTVQSRIEFVARDATFGQLIHDFDLHAKWGRLLDVEGKVLRRRADPGRILLNGTTAPRSAPLSNGDAIEVVNGIDRSEGTERVVTLLKGLRPGNPQLTLDTSRVEEIRVEGRISHKVVFVRFRSVGEVTRAPAVALTFDDGPWPSTTPRVLEILRRMHAKATFFVIGYLAQRYPGLIRSEIKAGMAIGNHSWDHPNSPPFKDLRPRRIRAEMSQMSDFMSGQFGLRTRLFRPPGGSYDADVMQIATTVGLRIVLWNVDPKDWIASETAKSITDAVLANVRPGSIVDLHDGGGDQSAMIRALPRIIRGIRKMGLRLVTIGSSRTRGRPCNTTRGTRVSRSVQGRLSGEAAVEQWGPAAEKALAGTFWMEGRRSIRFKAS
jgi:peptidoglycan/xylan/chitin deacetylase (PgdA/CDA1 family)